LDVVSATGAVYSGQADEVIAPATEGEIAVLPSHAALITTLRPGELRIKAGPDETSLAVSGGFLEVISNRVTVLADQAEQAEAIDLAKAEEALRLAQQRVTELPKEQDLERALSELRSAQVRASLARRTRERHAPPRQR
jgi:F-type H+-transporting ATPase subunit epsilon